MCPPTTPSPDAYDSDPQIRPHFSQTPPLVRLPKTHHLAGQPPFVAAKIRSLCSDIYRKHGLTKHSHYGLYYAGKKEWLDDPDRVRTVVLVFEMGKQDIETGRWREVDGALREMLEMEGAYGRVGGVHGVCLRYYQAPVPTEAEEVGSRGEFEEGGRRFTSSHATRLEPPRVSIRELLESRHRVRPMQLIRSPVAPRHRERGLSASRSAPQTPGPLPRVVDLRRPRSPVVPSPADDDDAVSVGEGESWGVPYHPSDFEDLDDLSRTTTTTSGGMPDLEGTSSGSSSDDGFSVTPFVPSNRGEDRAQVVGSPFSRIGELLLPSRVQAISHEASHAAMPARDHLASTGPVIMPPLERQPRRVPSTVATVDTPVDAPVVGPSSAGYHHPQFGGLRLPSSDLSSTQARAAEVEPSPSPRGSETASEGASGSSVVPLALRPSRALPERTWSIEEEEEILARLTEYVRRDLNGGNSKPEPPPPAIRRI